MSWHQDKTTRPWYAAQKMVVRKQLCMNTLISLLLFSIATHLVRFIGGRLSLAQVGHCCLFGTSEDALDINPTFVFSSCVSQCLQGDVQAGCFFFFVVVFSHGCMLYRITSARSLLRSQFPYPSARFLDRHTDYCRSFS